MPLSLVGERRAEDFYRRRCEEAAGPVLVLGAGDGDIAAEIAAAGLAVVAVESQPFFLAQASARLEGTGVTLVDADPRSFTSPQRFAAVLAPRNALGVCGTAEALQAFLGTIATHLAPDGLFALDAAAIQPLGGGGPQDSEAPMGPGYRPHLRARGEGKGSAVRRLARPLLEPAALDRALRAVGLEARERFGDFGVQPFGPDDRLQVVVGGRREG